ncbi:MAG: DUF3429 domain-containing protein [Zoogloea sp.]|uniref:DUF3429 domain-containing protein n=1 Tax=Zoogloea sp. TaxID=49181 RepID=UPI0026120894|nr:DUF3429 domain-containing protein [Zoogloea sp.]MDD3325641.1 DUF3429 domain-containing protein [Zoogloea sp.]
MNTPLSPALPRSAAWLGFGGLLPFIGLALTAFVDRHHGIVWADALVAYGAVILSFVGALHWGFAMALPAMPQALRRNCFVWSVVPALLAWPAVMLEPASGAPLLVAGFVAHIWQDHRLAGRVVLPDWYLPLRRQLSIVACVCLALGTFAVSH